MRIRLPPRRRSSARHNATRDGPKPVRGGGSADGEENAGSSRGACGARWITSSWRWRPMGPRRHATPRPTATRAAARLPAQPLLVRLHDRARRAGAHRPRRLRLERRRRRAASRSRRSLTDAPEIAGGLGRPDAPGPVAAGRPRRAARPATFLRRGTQPWGFDFRVTGADGLADRGPLGGPLGARLRDRPGARRRRGDRDDAHRVDVAVRAGQRPHATRVGASRTRSGRPGSAASAAPASSASARRSTNPSTDMTSRDGDAR